MPHLEYDAVEDLPSGLCACRLNGECVHIFALSPHSLWLRTTEICPPDSTLTLALYRPGKGDYEQYSLKELQLGSVQRLDGAVLTQFSFQDPACTAAIRRALNSYARYLEIKSGDGAAAYAACVTDYPAEADDCFHPDLHSQRRAWFCAPACLPDPPENMELAVELNCPELWNLYLQHPLEEFMNAYRACRCLPEAYLANRVPDRLYVGNAYCRHLFPDEAAMHAITKKAKGEGVALSIISAELRVHSARLADFQIALADQLNAELIANDWGMLERASKVLKPGQIVLGTLMNRRRKDPRIEYKAGYSGHEALLSGNNLNDPVWIDFLRSMGVERFEFESCGQQLQIPPGRHSLHLPFYHTNISLWCPLRALCLHGDRGAQADAPSCPHYCEHNALLYPAHLNLLGRWNALLALDAHICIPADHEHIDRWVLNF